MKAGEGRVSSSGCSNMIENDLEMASVHKVSVRPPESMLHCIEGAVKETLFPDDPFRQFKNQPAKRKCFLGVQYLFPILEWAPKYSLKIFKSDLISGITIASLAIPQGISYAKLANLPPILGLYSSFVPPLIYAMLGSSRDLAVGTVAVVSLLIGSLIAKEISPAQNPQLALHLALTATFFAGIFQASMGIFRLGFVIDFLSHATIVGFMAGAATVVSLQQLKGILGLQHFTTETDIVSAMRSVWGQTHKWRWETIVLGISFLSFLLITRYISKKRPRLFWISAAAPLTTVILSSVLVYATHAEKHGVEIVGHLKSGLNPLTVESFMFEGKYLKTLVKTGLIIGIITLTEGIAVGRTFALFKNYNIDGNKEMIAIGMMNIVGSCTSCYITTGAFSRSAVNFNAGCKTAVSNIVMAIAVMITLLFLTPLFHYTPLVVLSSIIISAMLGLIDIPAAYHLWKVDKVDFLVCMGAYVGVVFGNIEIGLIIAVTISLLRLILHVSRPHTAVLGNIPNTTVYRNAEQYPDAARVPGILILRIDAPIYFSNASYLRERIMRWIMDEEERLAKMKEDTLQYVIIDMAPVTTVDTSGIRMLEELKKTVELTGLQLALSNPGSDLMEKLEKAKFTEFLGPNWLFLTVGEGVAVCSSLLQARKLNG
ncbi:hypothetical protein SUGI_0691740 [Cryptomeria japonica]|uniref:sulfate transporter 3.1 isoform X1 n=1 Tax=Cryptomeria japonica TaxID=3369 RepID=UPI002414AF6B|nr:sulfate transporter 3.1 isoform X1 [Cryptomeria japonica]GLJ34406.1 hypothetical protein SUGI_0691740 [Cryptomeria japonica]